MQNENEPKVKSLYKALKLLEYFDDRHKEAGVTELAEYSGLLKSSVHNILQTFELCGYVTQNSDSSKYMLGGAAVSLFSRYKETRKIDYRITEYLQHLRSQFDANVYFGEKDQDTAVYLCAEQAFYAKGNYLSKEGARVPLHCTSIGKILLGFSTVEEKEKFYQKPLKQYTPNTITDPEKLREEMDRIIYDGYALTNSEYQEGMYCIAVPVMMGDAPVRYAIAIGTREPISHYMHNLYLSELKHVSREIGGILSS